MDIQSSPEDDEDYGQTALHVSATHGEPSDVQKIQSLLYKERADPNQQDDNGDTPLHLAAERGHIEIVWILLRAGANPNQENNYGQTAFQFARDNGHTEIAQLLLNAGAWPDAKMPVDNQGIPIAPPITWYYDSLNRGKNNTIETKEMIREQIRIFRAPTLSP